MTVPDFSTYHLKAMQEQKIQEWLEYATENWYTAQMTLPAPKPVRATEAAYTIYYIWLNGLVELRQSKGLETNPQYSALMFRSQECAQNMLAGNEFFAFMTSCFDPEVLVQVAAVKADHDAPASNGIVERYRAYFKGDLNTLVPGYSVASSQPVIVEAELLDRQAALLDKAREALAAAEKVLAPTPVTVKEGTWWHEEQDDDEE